MSYTPPDADNIQIELEPDDRLPPTLLHFDMAEGHDVRTSRNWTDSVAVAGSRGMMSTAIGETYIGRIMNTTAVHNERAATTYTESVAHDADRVADYAREGGTFIESVMVRGTPTGQWMINGVEIDVADNVRFDDREVTIDIDADPDTIDLIREYDRAGDFVVDESYAGDFRVDVRGSDDFVTLGIGQDFHPPLDVADWVIANYDDHQVNPDQQHTVSATFHRLRNRSEWMREIPDQSGAWEFGLTFDDGEGTVAVDDVSMRDTDGEPEGEEIALSIELTSDQCGWFADALNRGTATVDRDAVGSDNYVRDTSPDGRQTVNIDTESEIIESGDYAITNVHFSRKHFTEPRWLCDITAIRI